MNRFKVKVMPNHGAKIIVDTLAASNSTVSQLPSSCPMESAPRTSVMARAVTCSLTIASSDASSIPLRPMARRSDISACAGACGAGVGACGAGNGAGDDATTGPAVSVVEGLTLVIGVRSANSPQQRIASGMNLQTMDADGDLRCSRSRPLQ
ncbi:hypothetical protein PCAR4_640034 [Paraburkholderia caribensis]|nr:hypothetical protein PCAR4_640034 [Paraburkholderia caribensis]